MSLLVLLLFPACLLSHSHAPEHFSFRHCMTLLKLGLEWSHKMNSKPVLSKIPGRELHSQLLAYMTKWTLTIVKLSSPYLSSSLFCFDLSNQLFVSVDCKRCPCRYSQVSSLGASRSEVVWKESKPVHAKAMQVSRKQLTETEHGFCMHFYTKRRLSAYISVCMYVHIYNTYMQLH